MKTDLFSRISCIFLPSEWQIWHQVVIEMVSIELLFLTGTSQYILADIEPNGARVNKRPDHTASLHTDREILWSRSTLEMKYATNLEHFHERFHLISVISKKQWLQEKTICEVDGLSKHSPNGGISYVWCGTLQHILTELSPNYCGTHPVAYLSDAAVIYKVIQSTGHQKVLQPSLKKKKWNWSANLNCSPPWFVIPLNLSFWPSASHALSSYVGRVLHAMNLLIIKRLAKSRVH